MFKKFKRSLKKHSGIADARATYGGLLFFLAIQDCAWLKHKGFSFGGYAMDTFSLHCLFRILNDVKPKNIVEFGLGQSSKMVHQYAEFHKANALTVEHDAGWINYIKTHAPTINFNIRQADLETVTVCGAKTVTYKNIEQLCENGEVNLYIVDGPPGQRRCSRPQILDVVPQTLAKDFCIFIHDTDRSGERQTVRLLCKKLSRNGVEFLRKDYTRGERWHTVICSKSWMFLTSII
jgi:hypothetical protein